MAATLLLLSPSAPAAGRTALLHALADQGPLVAPDWSPGAGADLLTGPARAALARLDEQPDPEPALVCGVAAGALVALQLAVLAPGRVQGLVLCTGVRPLATVVRSVYHGVAGLLPVSTLQRLGGRGDALVPLLDAVRQLDHARLSPQVRVPAVVPYGARDPVNRRPSELLARGLPQGAAVRVPDAGPGWVWREPGRLAAVVAELRRRR